MIGETISHYHILEKLGAGGMGEVYKAEDTRLHRPVALKLLLSGIEGSREAMQRLVHEAQAASILNHPNIVTIYEVDEYEREGVRHPFIAMEFVQGQTLSEYARTRPLSVGQKLQFIEQVADALREAHQHGIIHRDIKPSNVLINEKNQARLLDFGLARQMELPDGNTASEFRTELMRTIPGRVMGTLAYMSPEQALGKEVDQRTDIFSLGVLAYELLSGKHPFSGRTSLAMVDAILHATPQPLSADRRVAPELDAVIHRMLEKEAARRYQDLREIIATLDSIRRQVLSQSDISAGVDPFSTNLNVRVTDKYADLQLGTTTIAARAERSVAVMSFGNITRNPDDEWLGAGIAETVTADLKNVEGLTVIGRERIYETLRHLSADRRTDFDEKLATQVGREIGARYIVGGGYQRMGEMLRITARVVAVDSGEILETVKLDGRISELFELQDRIVYELSRKLDLRLHSGEQAAIAEIETEVMAAYEAHTKALMGLRTGSPAAFDRAIALLEEAIALDPKYARAYADKGMALNIKGQFTSQLSLCEEAIGFFQKAIELRPMLPDSYSGLGMTFLVLGREAEAEGAIRRALAFAPDDYEVNAGLGRLQMLGRGNFREAAECFEKALRGNQQAGWIILQLAHCYAYLGDYERGEKYARQAVESQERATPGSDIIQIIGAYSRLAHILYLQGRYEDAVVQCYRELVFLRRAEHGLRDRSTIEVNQKLLSAYVRQGSLDEARRVFTEIEKSFSARLQSGHDDPATRYYVACACAMMGETDKAIEHLEKAAQGRRAFTIERARRDMDFESLKDEVRFKKLIEV